MNYNRKFYVDMLSFKYGWFYYQVWVFHKEYVGSQVYYLFKYYVMIYACYYKLNDLKIECL